MGSGLGVVAADAQGLADFVVADALGALRLACDALAGRDLGGVDEAALHADIAELTTISARINAERLRRVAAVADRAPDPASGRDAAQRALQTAGRASSSQAARETRLATALADPRLTPTAQAFAAGQISADQADVLARAARTHPGLIASSQPELVEAAARLDDRTFREVMADHRHAADPVPEEARACRQYAARRLTVSSLPDGMVRVDGVLDQVGGAKLCTALHASAGPDPATVPDAQRRTSEQRMADALVHLAERALARNDELPTTAGLQPTATVFLTPETLAEDPGAPAAQLEWIGRIAGATARRIACDADVVRRLVNRNGRTVALDVRRYPSPAQRLAVIERDRTCRFTYPDGTSCGRPWQWSDVHHITHHGDGGPTLTPNLVLLCGQHHHDVHEGGWQITGTPDDGLTFHPPLGWPRHRPARPIGHRRPPTPPLRT